MHVSSLQLQRKAHATAGPAILRWLLIGTALLFLGLFLVVPLVAVFTYAFEYFPSEVHIHEGETFKFANYDVVQGQPSHSIDEFIPGCTAPPYKPGAGKNCPRTRFSSGLTDWMQVHEVHGTDKLAPGTYQFVCQVHPFMRGTLVVE